MPLPSARILAIAAALVLLPPHVYALIVPLETRGPSNQIRYLAIVVIWALLLVDTLRNRWTRPTTVAASLVGIGGMLTIVLPAIDWSRDGDLDPWSIDIRSAVLGGFFGTLFATFLVGVPMTLLLAVPHYRDWTRVRRISRGGCLQCRHQLLDDQTVCPECGAARLAGRPASGAAVVPIDDAALRVGPSSAQVWTVLLATWLAPTLIATAVLDVEELLFGLRVNAAQAEGITEVDERSIYRNYFWWSAQRGYGSHRD